MNQHLVLFLSIIFLLQACGPVAAPVQQRSVVVEPEPQATQRGISTQTTTNITVESASRQVNSKADYHIVMRGDTLYSISWRYNKDYKNVASWNRSPSPYRIYPGQIIRLRAPKISASQVTNMPTKKGEPLQKETVSKLPSKPDVFTSSDKTLTKPSKVIANSHQEKKPLPSGPVKWNWPTLGKIVKANTPTSKNGIDISGKMGQTIKAAATGDVVYSGSGLFGYGKLIIIKHNETYLSAYAYNSKVLVKEGDRVRSGQPISYMGQDHSGRTILHFEIRKNGQPINPIQYLPKRSA